ncbi:MAG: lysophospholipase [Clostridium sp.]|uniref:alpha/beta hydrolase n=1 Tax=Clostridium chrysemydis TaxID=2665504 RepID=UPI003EE747FF
MKNFIFKDRYNKDIQGYVWKDEKVDDSDIKGVVQIAHGMTEWAGRYDYFARRLVKEGYVVYANDHRGHGKSAEKLGYACDIHGFNSMVDGMNKLNSIIRTNHPSKEIILFGHSMGSFLSQRYAEIYGDTIDKLILSGTNGKPDKITKLGRLIAKIEMTLKGREHVSKLMDKLSFGSFNNKFKPVRTNFDWLCGDEKEVDKYIEDKYCGFVCTSSFYHDLIDGIWSIHNEDNLKCINKNMPIFIFAGDKDPVGKSGQGILNLYNSFIKLGVKDVKYKLYKDGRHEMLNEKNKDEVISDVLAWLEKNN